MKKLGALILSFLLLFMFPIVRSAETPVQFSPLQQTINNAPEGTTVKIPTGTYYGLLKINKTLTLIATNVTIDANGSQVGIIVSAPYVTLQGFKIQNAVRFGNGSIPEQIKELWSNPEMEGAGIYVYQANRAVISNVNISDCYAGIGFTHSYTTKVSNVSIDRTLHGIMMYSSMVEIFNSKIINGLKEYTAPDGRTQSAGAGIIAHHYSQMNMTYTTLLNTNYALSISALAYFSTIKRNNFVNNTHQVFISPGARWVAEWDRNYWSDYRGADLYSGPYQNITGSDGIGDEPYIIDAYNKDDYPSMTDPIYTAPAPNPADINNDGKVDIQDVAIVALAYGSQPTSENWNTMAELTNDGKVDIRDIAIVALAYGQIA